MITPPPIVIAQSYECVMASTSATAEQSASLAEPASMMRVGTSHLAPYALAFALLVHDAASYQHNAVHTPRQHGALVQSVPTVQTARSSEMVATIIKSFGLNRSQAADVMRVRRQSIYNWLGGAEAEGENLDRMLLLFGIANSLAQPIEPHLTIRSTPDGTNSLLRMLSADSLDPATILTWVTALVQPSEIPWPQPLDDVLREDGIPRNAERESQRGADGIRYLQG